jgi:hypothetical protein
MICYLFKSTETLLPGHGNKMLKKLTKQLLPKTASNSGLTTAQVVNLHPESGIIHPV